MTPFTTHRGPVAPLDRANVDTDAIIPKQFLKSIRRSGFGPYLFDEWRYLDAGEPDQDCSARPRNEEFVLNQPKYADATILLARDNFGCGSSREHAVWALTDFGFRAVIAPSFADIFYNNCFKNGLLPIVLPTDVIDGLFAQLPTANQGELQIDLGAQTVTLPGGQVVAFDIDPVRKERLMAGLDDIGLTLQHADAIRAFEMARRQQHPWLFGPTSDR